jgi:hypothetical protein
MPKPLLRPETVKLEIGSRLLINPFGKSKKKKRKGKGKKGKK